MAKSKKPGRHRGKVSGGRTTPKGGGGGRARHLDMAPDEPPFVAEVRRMLRDDEHGLQGLLALVSTVLAVSDPRRHNPFDPSEEDGPELAELVEAFGHHPGVEAAALLTVVAHLQNDELVTARARRELARRTHALPGWLDRLGEMTTGRCVEMVEPFHDGDNVMIGVEVPGAPPFTLVAFIDHNVGSLVKDAFPVPLAIDDTVEEFRAAATSPDLEFLDISPADARARVTEGIARWAMTVPRFESDTWPHSLALLEWVVAALPEGGAGYERPEWSDEDRAELIGRFLASPFVAGLGADAAENASHLLETFLWFGCDYGPGDPMRWSPVAVDYLLEDFIPRKVIAPAEELSPAPEVLAAFVRFCHAERGLRPGLTDETLEAVERHGLVFQDLIRSVRPQGIDALMGMMEEFGLGGGHDSFDLDDPERTAYRLKVTLAGAKPPIWRRVLVPSTFSLGQLHDVIQVAFGWQDCHLHAFDVDGERFGSAHSRLDHGDGPDDEAIVELGELVDEDERFGYTYDFGDSWKHTIEVEAVEDLDPHVTYPVCIAGRRAGPPEDVGGIWGYQSLLEVIADPDHPEHDEMLEWVGGSWDAATFDKDAVNERLAKLSPTKPKPGQKRRS